MTGGSLGSTRRVAGKDAGGRVAVELSRIDQRSKTVGTLGRLTLPEDS